jgi:hypothetical protein
MLSRKASCHRKNDLFYGKNICAVINKPIPRPDASMEKSFFDFNMQHTLLFGKPLRALSTKHYFERNVWPRSNSGMVIMKGIGQSACLLPKVAMQDYGRASETERVWVSNDRLAILNLLKIQSGFHRNMKDRV